jgi:hypothetical protein
MLVRVFEHGKTAGEGRGLEGADEQVNERT